MANGNDWFSSGLGSVAAQRPIWPVPQGWQNPQVPVTDQPQQPSGFWFGNPQDYLGAISLAKVGKPDPWGGQAFHMFNEQGQKVGDLEAHMAEPDLLKIDWEGGAGGSNALGFANSRSVLPELLREFPDMKRYSAYRVSGARHGPAAQFKGLPGEGGDLPYMTPIKNVPAHIKPNPPNQWSGKWLHEDSGRWYGDDEGPDPRRIQIDARTQGLIDRLRGNQLMEESEGEEVPPALSQRVLEAARARESVNTPQELQDLQRNLANWRERLDRMNRPLTPPAPPVPRTEVPFPGALPRSVPMGTFQPQTMNLQMMADQLQRQRMGYGGAGSQRMEEE